MTSFWPLTTTGIEETAVQFAGGMRLAVDCKAYPETVLSQATTTLVPARNAVSRGGFRERLKIVPRKELPPADVVP